MCIETDFSTVPLHPRFLDVSNIDLGRFHCLQMRGSRSPYVLSILLEACARLSLSALHIEGRDGVPEF